MSKIKKSKRVNRSYIIFIILGMILTIGSAFIGWRWYMINHPYANVTFTTYKPSQTEVANAELILQGYKDNLFSDIFAPSYSEKKVRLNYELPHEEVRVSQEDGSQLSNFTERDCNDYFSAFRCITSEASNNQRYMALTSNTSNATGEIEGILILKDIKDKTLIQVMPIDHSKVFPLQKWDELITTVFSRLEPHSFEGSPYWLYDKHDI